MIPTFVWHVIVRIACNHLDQVKGTKLLEVERDTIIAIITGDTCRSSVQICTQNEWYLGEPGAHSLGFGLVNMIDWLRSELVGKIAIQVHTFSVTPENGEMV